MPEQFSDERKVVHALRALAPSIKESSDRAWFRSPAIRVIDCVLSLNRDYDRFVVPRLDSFERKHSDTASVCHLRKLIETFPSAHQFVKAELRYDHEDRAIILHKVVVWLSPICREPCDEERIKVWALKAKPADHSRVGIWGFGLSGFQYLRMLFGANTTKPDLHIRRQVATWVGHPVSALQALQLLEAGAEEAGVSLRNVDTTIWENSARGQRLKHLKA